MKTIQATFEGGVFRPTDIVELPEHCRVEFEPRIVGDPQDDEGLDAIYAVLSRSYETGEHDVAARHNEHQP